MVTGIYLAILGMMFFFLKYLYDKVILKKSDDDLALEKLYTKQIDLIESSSIFKSKEKKDREMADLDKEIDLLKNKIANSKTN